MACCADMALCRDHMHGVRTRPSYRRATRCALGGRSQTSVAASCSAGTMGGVFRSSLQNVCALACVQARVSLGKVPLSPKAEQHAQAVHALDVHNLAERTCSERSDAADQLHWLGLMHA